MKKKIILVCIVLALGILLFGKGLLVRNVYIDVLDKGEKEYSRIELSKEDSKAIRKIICPKIVLPDKGFVFEEGNYRFVFETLGMEVHMYPYCGYPDTLRVGDKGSWLIELDYFAADESDTVEKIVEKYMDDAGGIWDWSNVKKYENDIEHLLKTAIRIQYGWENIDELNQICTEEFLENTDLDEVYLGRRLYTIEKGYMDTVREIGENELEVIVSVYSPDIRFHHFTIIQDEDGKYLISNIEHDM